MRNPSYKFYIQVTEENTSVTTNVTELLTILTNKGYLHYISGAEYSSDSSYLSNYIEIPVNCEVSWNESVQVQVVRYNSNKVIQEVFNGYEGSFSAKKGEYMRISSVNSKVTIKETQTDTIFTPATYREVFPIYKELKIQADKESGQVFFRKKIDGKLTFVRDDFDWIDSQDFEFEYILIIKQSFDGNTWNELIRGKFFKTDGEWNPVSKIVKVSCRIKDEYEDLINNLDKEFDMIQLLPQIEKVDINRGPALQTYVLGSDTLGYYHNGIYWEDSVNQSVNSHEDMLSYGFKKAGTFCAVHFDNIAGHSYASPFDGNYWGRVDNNSTDYLLNTDNKSCKAYYNNGEIYLCSNSATDKSQALKYFNGAEWYTRGSSTASWQKDSYQADTDIFDVYTRILVAYKNTFSTAIPVDDISSDNRNYRYYSILPYSINAYVVSLNTSKTPTKYGRADDTSYFAEPTGNGTYYPVAKSKWIMHSLWINTENLTLPSANSYHTLRHSYTLSSVISKFLSKISSIKHDETCSKFLYEKLKASDKNVSLLLTPKSNLLHGDYDTPAQKCVTTLETILNALRDMFRCYWYIEDGFLKIEHEEFFRNGYSYDIDSRRSLDLSNILVKPNGKNWAYGQQAYSYDLSNMPQKYTFSWMDSVTSKFDTDGVDIVSKFVSEGQTQEISVNTITTDVDYLILCPNSVNEDGMVMLGAIKNEQGKLQLPYVGGAQNGILAWNYLINNFYQFAFPSKKIKFEGMNKTLSHTSQNCKQKVKIPYISTFSEKTKIKVLTTYADIEKYSISLQTLIIEANLAYEQ